MRGIEKVDRTPRLPNVVVLPFLPTDTEGPLFPILMRNPGMMRTDFRKRKPILVYRVTSVIFAASRLTGEDLLLISAFTLLFSARTSAIS